MSLSVVIITLNEERNIERCLQSLGNIADEILVVDSGSTDGTKAICEQYDCRFIHHPFEGYGKQKQFATAMAKNDWVLSLDADEELSKELRDEIFSLLNETTKIEFSAYSLPISLVFMGRLFKYGYESKQAHLRLFDRTRSGFDASDVHEKVNVDGKAGKLKGVLLHYSHQDLSHFFEKFNHYSSLAANTIFSEGKKVSLLKVLFKLKISFLINYFIRLNFLNGSAGLIWSINDAFYRYVKYLKVYEKQQLNEKKS